MPFEIHNWPAEDQQRLSAELTALFASMETAIPDNPAVLIQVGALIPGLGDWFEDAIRMFANAAATEERIKS